MERIRKLLVPGEQRLLGDLDGMLRMSDESLGLLIALFSSRIVSTDLIVSKTSKITELEKKSDLIVTEIEKNVATGAISPSLIDDFLRLSERVDGILDIAHSMSREVSRVYKYRKDEPTVIEKRIYAEVPKLLELGVLAVRSLLEMIVAAKTTPREMSIYTERIESLEEQADDLKDSMLDEIFASAGDVPYYVYNHLVRLTVEGDDVLDRCEDASDIIAILIAALGL